MKKHLLVTVLVAALMVFVGCSKDTQAPVTSNGVSEQPHFITLPAKLDKSLPKIASVTKFFYAAQGGTLELTDSYKAAPDSHLVSINIKLELQPGDLPNDASLTLSIDDVAFLTNVDLTFGPHGITFNNPARLTVTATGLDLSVTTSNVKLYYIDNGVWVKMNGSNGSYYVGQLDAKGKLPHFSQYAFGRVDE